MKPTILIIIFLLNISNLYSQGKTEGEFWNNLSLEKKYAYLRGFVDGTQSSTVFRSLIEQTKEKQARGDYSFTGTVSFSGDPLEPLYEIELFIILQALDSFYSDYANNKIQIYYALSHIAMRICGGFENSRAEENALNELRRISGENRYFRGE